jgi:hypothetical protein
MYGGALFTLITAYMSLLGLGLELYQLITRKSLFSKWLSLLFLGNGNIAFCIGYGTYLGTWLFWSGYVKLAGERLCASFSFPFLP